MIRNEKVEICIKMLKSKIILPLSHLKKILQKAKEIIRKEPNIIEINPPITVCGYIGGGFFDLLEIFRIAGTIPETNYLFLGTLLSEEWGFSLEILSLLLCLKILYPKRVILLRTERDIFCLESCLYDEIRMKYANDELIDLFYEIFLSLPLAAIIDGTIFCVNSGLSPEVSTKEQILNLDRFHDIMEDRFPQTAIIKDFLCNRPFDNEKQDWNFEKFDENNNYNAQSPYRGFLIRCVKDY